VYNKTVSLVQVILIEDEKKTIWLEGAVYYVLGYAEEDAQLKSQIAWIKMIAPKGLIQTLNIKKML
jgi:hypothetical protein